MSDEIAHDLYLIKVYKDGRVERPTDEDTIPPSLDHKTGVQSADVVVSSETGLSVRLYIPKTAINTPQKLPLLVYFPGGAFCIGSAFSPSCHNYINSIVGSANIVAVSVNYRRAPENPIPAAYDDSWDAVKWVASHFEGKGQSEWLNSNADLNRVFFAGDSAGANISHNMASWLGLSSSSSSSSEEVVGRIKLKGIVLVHPYFSGKDPIGSEVDTPEMKVFMDAFWSLASPASTNGLDDPLINPEKDPNLGRLGCERVLVCLADKDFLKERGCYYVESLRKSGWNGVVEVMEAKDEIHVFHLQNPGCENAIAMRKRIVSFISQQD